MEKINKINKIVKKVKKFKKKVRRLNIRIFNRSVGFRHHQGRHLKQEHLMGLLRSC